VHAVSKWFLGALLLGLLLAGCEGGTPENKGDKAPAPDAAATKEAGAAAQPVRGGSDSN